MAGARQEFAQTVALRLGGLALAIAVSGHLVGLVHHRQVPGGLGQSRQHVLLLGEVHGGDDLVVLQPDVAAPGPLHRRPVDDGEGLVEPLLHLPQPLVAQMARHHHQGAAHQAPVLELLEQEAGHDGLAGPGVVGQEEPYAVVAEHVVVDRLHLMGQGVYLRDVDR